MSSKNIPQHLNYLKILKHKIEKYINNKSM